MNSKTMARVFQLSLLIALFSNSKSLYGHTDQHPQRNVPIKVLFVGNSLTYSNNLPKLVEIGAKKMGVEIKTSMVAYPNYAMEDHWEEKKVVRLLEQENFDFLIVQQGPSSQNDGRKMLLDYGAKFKTVCNATNTRLVFFMVWPSLNYFRSMDQVISNYTEAASFNKALLCPVGAVWKDYIDQRGDLSLYEADGFHPSLKGSLLAAQVITDTLLEEISENGRR